MADQFRAVGLLALGSEIGGFQKSGVEHYLDGLQVWTSLHRVLNNQRQSFRA